MRQQSTALVFNTNDMSQICVSAPTNLISIYAYSIQVKWSGGTVSGNFSLQASNDPGDNGSGQGVSLPVNWTTVTDSIQIVSGSPDSLVYDVTECSYRWVRVVYTPTSGSGATLSAIINTKGA